MKNLLKNKKNLRAKKRAILALENTPRRIPAAAIISFAMSAILVAVVVLPMVFATPVNRPRRDTCAIHFLDCGQGDAAVIVSQGNVTMIDAGPATHGRAMLRFFREHGIAKIDNLLITHPHEDHFAGGIFLLQNIEIGRVYMDKLPLQYIQSPEYARFLQLTQEKNIPLLPIECGSVLEVGNAEILTVLPVTTHVNVNESSAIFKLRLFETTVLFQGDAGFLSEDLLLQKMPNIRACVLNIGHHGSNFSSSEEFLRAINPVYAIVSAGIDNTFRHPGSRVLRDLEALNIATYRTDIHATISFFIDENGYEIQTTRNNQRNNAFFD